MQKYKKKTNYDKVLLQNRTTIKDGRLYPQHREISERYRQMVVTDVDERLSANLMETLATVTPAELHTLAQSTLTDLVTVTAGA